MHDPGGKSILKIPFGIEGLCAFRGMNDEHRMWLLRRKSAAPVDAPFALWCGMTPSTASEYSDDMTIRKECTWTWMMGLERYIKVNVGTYRCTDPKLLNNVSTRDLVHTVNLDMIAAMAIKASKIVVACGDLPDVLEPFAKSTFEALGVGRREVLCLGLTKRGWPRHSSRIGYATPLVEFKG